MKRGVGLIIITLLAGNLYGQWECRSKLNAFLKPVGESNLMWGSELITSGGMLSNYGISNAMALLALDYSTSNSTFYFEGGYKYWNQTDFENKNIFSNNRWGIREALYSYNGNTLNFSVGLHSASLNDNFLLNERVLGASYSFRNDRWKLKTTVGTVSKDFARNGTFCSTCYLYDIIQDRSYNQIGNTLGESNLAGLTLSFLPGKKSIPQSTDDSEFSLDGFAPMEDNSSKKKFHVNEIGIASYTEFGDIITSNFLINGLFAKISLVGDITFVPEILLQSGENNNGLFSVLSLNKEYFWSNTHKSSFTFSYYGFQAFDENVVPLNRFSNLLAGEVLRLDVPETPIFLFAAKHTIPNIKTHFKIQYARSESTSTMSELDVQIGKIFFNRLQANLITGYIKSNLLTNENEAFLSRIELRLNF